MDKCPHCKMDIAKRNPSGFCDHLYYPDNCEECSSKVERKMTKRFEDYKNKKFKVTKPEVEMLNDLADKIQNLELENKMMKVDIKGLQKEIETLKGFE
jgi:hypothetical protein